VPVALPLDWQWQCHASDGTGSAISSTILTLFFDI
jgi:hypothetical protein